MNKTILPCVCFFALFLTACTGSQSSTRSAANSAANSAPSNSKVSFGVYDISKSGPDLRLNQGDLADTATSVPGGGGGGGGKSDPRSLLAKDQSISLTQASTSQIETVPVDRKIIRNA